MKWIYIAEAGAHVGEEVELRGWLYGRSSKGKLHFLLVRDGSGIIQCVMVKGEMREEEFAAADHIPVESSLVVRGDVRQESRAPGGYELGVRELKVVHAAEEYPLTPKEHGIAFLMEHRHLWLRSRRQLAILRLRHELIRLCRQYLDDRGFILVDSPILTPAACEGTTTLFQTDYFGEPAFLSQSGQLYQEAAAMALGRVYCFGPTFRAEKSKTRRHLMEFWMLEPEAAWLDLEGDMDLAEDLLVYTVQEIRKRRRAELEFLERDFSALERVEKPLPRITYDEALALLHEKGFSLPWGTDFGGDEEAALSLHFDRPVMIHHYPAGVKAFYMKADPARPETALCVDVLAPEGYGEIIGGGQREDDLAVLEAKIASHGLPRQAFSWYLDLRRYGSVPHAGFGLGLERTLAWICGLPHVREAIPFPRLLGKIWP